MSQSEVELAYMRRMTSIRACLFDFTSSAARCSELAADQRGPLTALWRDNRRGEVYEKDVEQFLAARFTRRNVLDILLGVAQKVMSNYVSHLAETPIDAALAWSKPRDADA